MMDEYISFEQVPFGSESFADNPEPRCPCVLLLDTSGSMAGKPIRELNDGIQAFRQELISDHLATKRVEVAIVTFGPVSIETNFQTVANFIPRTLHTTGDTPLGAAVATGIDLVTQRKKEYKEHGIAYYKPWIILITDGAPTDSWRHAAQQIREGEERKSFAFFAIGIDGANFEVLRELSVREPLKLRGLLFREFFLWLSASMKMVSSKNPGSNISLPPPSGWSEL